MYKILILCMYRQFGNYGVMTYSFRGLQSHFPLEKHPLGLKDYLNDQSYENLVLIIF